MLFLFVLISIMHAHVMLKYDVRHNLSLGSFSEAVGAKCRHDVEE